MDNDTLIKVEDLCKIYNPGENEVRALDHVSLEIKKGELVAIIGQSGSGKSTFMNMLGCLDVPTSGRYYLNGTDVSEMTDNELSEVRNREIGFIFQGFNLDRKSERDRKRRTSPDLQRRRQENKAPACRRFAQTGRSGETYGS